MDNNIALSQKEEQILFGGLLGDSYFNKNRGFIRFSHSNKQKEYLLWKMNHFSTDNIRGIYRRDYKEGYVNYSFEFINKAHQFDGLFLFLKKNLYSNEGRKKISLKYLYKLNSLGLAIWWMDDGCLSIHKGNRYGKLCTHCFNYEEHLLLKKYFKDKWEIDVQIKEEKHKYFFLRFNVKELKKLIKIIYIHICDIPTMIYKIDLDYKNNGNYKDIEDIYLYIKEMKNKSLNIKEF